VYLSHRNAEGFQQALSVRLHAARKPTQRAQTTICAADTTTAASTAGATPVTIAATPMRVGIRHGLPGRKLLLQLEPGLFAGAHEEHEPGVFPQPGQQIRHRREGLYGVKVIVTAAALVVAPPTVVTREEESVSNSVKKSD